MRIRGPRVFGLLLGSVVVAAATFLFVLPGRTYLAQQHSLAAAQTRLNVLADENKNLTDSAQRLRTDTEIERLARQQYGMVKPGEQAFAILPSGPTARPVVPAPPPGHRGLAGRLWHDVQFWR